MSRKAAVFLPLYIYPLPGAWDPLYEAIVAHPDLNFTLVINPHDGPGSLALPDSNYTREISILNSHHNVCTVGYIRVNYCKRDLAEVYRDVEVFAGWSKDYAKSGLAVHGIFFDETPNDYSSHNATYLDAISTKVKDSLGIMGDQLVIHNPGSTPDGRLTKPGPDVTAVVEDSFAQYQSVVLQKRLSLLPYDRDRCCYIVHSVPRNEVKRLTRQLRQRGKYVFVTDLRENFYVQFSPSWIEFIEALQME